MSRTVPYTPTGLRNKVVKTALAERGYVEKPVNRTKYAQALYPAGDGQPWCGYFTSWTFYIGTNQKLAWDHFNSYYTPAIIAWARKNGAWKTSNPQPGDWCLMNFPGGDFTDHVGITLEGVTNIEGNTAPSNGGSQNNGGGVYIRGRSRSMINGWVDLELMTTAVGLAFSKPSPEERKITANGVANSKTFALFQTHLNIARAEKIKRGASVIAWPTLRVDGEWGPLTIKALQSHVGAAVDGEDGPETAGKLATHIGATDLKPKVTLEKMMVRRLQGCLNAKIDEGNL